MDAFECDLWGGVTRCPNIIWVKYVHCFLNMAPPCKCARKNSSSTSQLQSHSLSFEAVAGQHQLHRHAQHHGIITQLIIAHTVYCSISLVLYLSLSPSLCLSTYVPIHIYLCIYRHIQCDILHIQKFKLIQFNINSVTVSFYIETHHNIQLYSEWLECELTRSLALN